MKTDDFEPTDGSAHVVEMGEDKAFDYFFRQYYTSLCFFANSILHNEDQAKDLVQDCFVKLWSSKTIRERCETVKSFLYTAVRNRCVDFLRRKKVMKKAELQLVKDNSDLDFEYFDEVAFAEMIRQVAKHIEGLPSKMQQVFRLYYIEGKKYKQIATELNSSPEAVRKQKVRALKLIRQKLLLLLSFF
jgi:RNA polymerase sigma-70 factor (ECF subfamily)